MRILHVVTNSDLGGAPRVVSELSARAVRDGHECAVAASPGGPMWDRLDPRVEQRPVFAMRRELSPAQDGKVFLFLQRLYRTYAPDIIHLHSSKAGALGRLAAIAMGGGFSRRCVYTVHGFDTILASHREFLLLERFLSERCGAVAPVSSYDEENLRRAGFKGRVILVRNGVTDRRNLQAANSGIARRLADAKAVGRPVVLSIARLEAPKRPDLFIDVARSVPEADFFWVGNMVTPGIECFSGAEAPANVKFLGECPEAGNLANLCDIFLLLSDYEGLPMSILEAMSCAKPVIASQVGGISEALGEGSGAGGILVPNETEMVAGRIRWLLDDNDLRRRMGDAARRRYETEFSAERMWISYLNLYRSMIPS